MKSLALLVTLTLPIAATAQEKPILCLDGGGHAQYVRKALFAANDKEVVTISDDKTIRVWDLGSGTTVRIIRPFVGYGSTGRIYGAALSPDGDTLAVCGAIWKYAIHLISLSRGKIEKVLTGHTDIGVCLAFSRDGKQLISGSADNTARIWSIPNGELLHTLKGHTDALLGVAFSPDGKWAVTAGMDSTGRIWDTAKGTAVANLRGHEKMIQDVAWSPDGRTIATASADRSLRIWEPDGTFRRSYVSEKSEIRSVAFTADSKELLLTRGGPESDNRCSMLDVASGAERVGFAKHNNTVFSGQLSKDGSLAATTGSNDNVTLVWRTTDGEVVAQLAGRGRSVWSAAWSPDGSTIAWSNEFRQGSDTLLADNPIDRSFRLTELEWGPPPDASFTRAKAQLGNLSLERASERTVSVKNGGASRTTLTLPEAPNQEVRSFTLLPGDRAVIGTAYGIQLYDTQSGERLSKFVGQEGAVWAVAPSPDNRFVLSGSSDQTLCIWVPERLGGITNREPLLSLFFAGDEWIAWTPEGYYAASPGGETLMGWHVNRGKNEIGEFHPAARFRKELYRPDVIKLLLKTGSLKEALAEADRLLGRATRPTSVEKLLPPKVSLEVPDRAGGGEVTVSAIAESRGEHPVTGMRLLLDGQPVDGKSGLRRFDQSMTGEVQAKWQVTLSPGKHRLQALADSAVSKGASEERIVVYESAPQPNRLPRLVVLAVGVSKYSNPSVGTLDYAAGDARAALRAFEASSRGLFREVKTKLLVDAEATRGNMLDGLDWLAKEISQDDYVVVFFAGHGEMDNIGNVYFLPVDADKEKLRRSAVSGEELMKVFRDLPPSKRILILDACHAGAVSTGKTRAAGGVTDSLARELLLPENGVVVMCSSTGREFSQESHQHKMGVFTLALTEGLSGKGPKDGTGLVFTHHLHSYVCDRVKELTKGQQHPVMKNPDEIRSFPVSKP